MARPIDVVARSLDASALKVPSIPNSLRADFGQPPLIELHGYDLAGLSVDEASPGDNLELTLFWRSLSESITTSYSVLVHLTDETGEIVAQGDGRPASGFRPTTSWRQGEVIVDAALNPEGTPYETVFSTKSHPTSPSLVMTKARGTIEIEESGRGFSVGPAKVVGVRLEPLEVQYLRRASST